MDEAGYPMTTQAQSFLAQLQALSDNLKPGIALDSLSSYSSSEGKRLRRLFVEDRGDDRLSDLHVGLIDVYEGPAGGVRGARAGVVKDDVDLAARHIFPLPYERRRKDGKCCMSENFQELEINWSVFTESSLSQLLDRSNVIAAGGSILACFSPIPPSDKETKSELRKHFHSSSFPSSDVDLFLYGLIHQAE